MTSLVVLNKSEKVLIEKCFEPVKERVKKMNIINLFLSRYFFLFYVSFLHSICYGLTILRSIFKFLSYLRFKLLDSCVYIVTMDFIGLGYQG